MAIVGPEQVLDQAKDVVYGGVVTVDFGGGFGNVDTMHTGSLLDDAEVDGIFRSDQKYAIDTGLAIYPGGVRLAVRCGV